MRNKALITAVLLWCSEGLASEPAPCTRQLESFHAPYPPYPSPEQARRYLKGTQYLHVFVKGSVSVEFTVTTAGAVADPRIVESTHKPIVRGSGSYPPAHFVGFLEMNVLSTLKQWRYKPVEQACRGTFVFTYELRDDV